jgi:hypothetical protein
MPTLNNFLRGGRAVTGNALDPRGRRANTAQANTYWSGVSQGGTDAIGGIGPSVPTGSGYRYLQFNSTGALTVTGAGTFEFYIFGGGAGGGQANGYNGFSAGGLGGSNTTVTKKLDVGTYTVTVGAGGAGSVGYGGGGVGGDSYFDTDTTNKGAGGLAQASGGSGLLNINGAAGTDVSSFIGGASLFKGAGGGNANSGNGGSSIGGNGRQYPTAATSAAANTASGGGSANADGLPNFNILNAGAGGSGIVYVRWRA